MRTSQDAPRLSDTSQSLGKVALGPEDRQFDMLVADQPGTAIDGHRVNAAAVEIGLGACDEERADIVKGEQAFEVDIAPVHHVDRFGFGWQKVQNIDVVEFAIRDVDVSWDIAA